MNFTACDGVYLFSLGRLAIHFRYVRNVPKSYL